MSLTCEQIHEKLSARLPEAIGPWAAPAAGDPFITVAPAALHEVCKILKEDAVFQFDLLRLISGVDRGEGLASVYHLYSTTQKHGVALHVELEREQPRVASVADLWPAADWHEREAWDMMGIVYEGHPELRRILLPEDWDGFPLRKDYTAPKEYHGVSNE